MEEVSIDLKQIQFSDSDNPLFEGEELKLSSKNFIFAKNGSGKSTLCNAIVQQKSSEYEVHLFNGFESLIGENEYLDAFALSVNASANESEIKRLEAELQNKKSELDKTRVSIENVVGSDNIYSKLETAKNEYEDKKRELEKIYTKSAAEIAKMSNPSLVINARSYDKRKFKHEIQEAKLLQEVEIQGLKEILSSEFQIINEITFKNIDFEKYLKSVNEIITSKVEERISISRLSSQEKINFADKGRHIHEKGQDCAFCGNKISDTVFEELESYFSADEVKSLQERIKKGKEIIVSQIDLLGGIKVELTKIYPKLSDVLRDETEKIEHSKRAQQHFLDVLYSELENKEKNLFMESPEIDIEIPNQLNFSSLNKLIAEHNKFVSELEQEKTSARDQLRYHHVKALLDENKHDVVINNLNNLKNIWNEKQKVFEEESRVKQLDKEIQTLQSGIDGLKPKAEKEAIERINKKLRRRVKWELDFAEDGEFGYYRIKQGNHYRSVKKLSTGEKNVIAFLYFIEKLEEQRTEKVVRPKFIIFDDPMNSNDDTMQYLIIWELQNIYQGQQKAKFDINKDIFLVLTHNVHFYLNVQPHGNFKDENGKTKYDKNHFYRIDSRKFIKIESEKDDFKTSYHALWLELKDLYDCGHKNSMLNTMRRIIETFMKFNSLNPIKFYKHNEQYLKLFNVNSHSIDDLSAESFAETKEEMRSLFYQIFEENNYKEHFESYWKF